ncbi:MAG: LVIVD repeat-containing protein [Actinomycetota bacterium]
MLFVLSALSAVAVPAGAADADLVNFEHVFNYPFSATGTDLEFYTATVPLRDYATGGYVDEQGNPLADGAAPIMAARDFAVVGAEDKGAFVFDITDPAHPAFVRLIACAQSQNDVQIKQFGDRWILALARDGSTIPCVRTKTFGTGGAGIAVFDITDPYLAKGLWSFRVTGGAHNFTFHPTKPYGWVSTAELPGAASSSAHIPIIDFTDLSNPVLAGDVSTTEGSPHDISFSADGSRAYVAAENNLQIWDSTDPVHPARISVTVGPATYVHGLDPTPNRKLMVMTDEDLALGGFFAPAAVCPGGGLTFYDIDGSLESAPVPVGFFEAEVRGPSTTAPCTAHVGRIAANNHVMTTAWYGGGVRVVDFSNPSTPTEIGHAVMPGTDAWSAKFFKGPYVYVGDLSRGFDVFKWTGAGTPPWEAA